jgi:hypothetical protein
MIKSDATRKELKDFFERDNNGYTMYDSTQKEL